ncbi:MAG: 4Fe-4S cluster-binding domain-containing protein [Burkholderiales bacterium]|nr:4Fe-4S cluster-binding domain-containing protein [Burkholderiales bacterium]
MKASITLEVNKAHWPVTVLGPGRRIGLWLQGCTIHCPGCVSQDTWPKDESKAIRVSDVLAWCRKVAAGGFDGVTISGGEPFEQPAGLRALLAALVAWRRADHLDFDLLCYSGIPLSKLRRRHAAILALLDAIIPEPYVNDLPQGNVWRGSRNQPLVALSERGRARYAAHIDAAADGQGKRMQAAVEGGRVWMIGIPGRGDMAAVETLCASRGLALTHVSWRR